MAFSAAGNSSARLCEFFFSNTGVARATAVTIAGRQAIVPKPALETRHLDVYRERSIV